MNRLSGNEAAQNKIQTAEKKLSVGTFLEPNGYNLTALVPIHAEYMQHIHTLKNKKTPAPNRRVDLFLGDLPLTGSNQPQSTTDIKFLV